MSKTTLDFKGMKCPMPVLKIASVIKQANTGDEFEITADDPAFEPDIKAWCHRTGHKVGAIQKKGTDIIAVVTKV